MLSENNKLNLILQQLASKADGVLDLHTGPVATRYLYAAEYEKEVSKYLKFKHILIIPNEFGGAMDEASFMPWIHLLKALKKYDIEVDLDIESFTLEFGSEETFCMENASKDVESIINYFKYKGMIEGSPDQIDAHSCHLDNFKTIYSPSGGLVDYHFDPGQRFLKGDTLASFYNFKKIDPTDPIVSSRSSIIAQQDGIIINRCPSSSIHEGMELFQVMTKLEEHRALK
jgi:predicted deacylase